MLTSMRRHRWVCFVVTISSEEIFFKYYCDRNLWPPFRKLVMGILTWDIVATHSRLSVKAIMPYHFAVESNKRKNNFFWVATSDA